MAVQRALESTRPQSSRLFRDAFARQFVSGRWRLVLAASRLGVARRAVEALYDRVAGPGPRASAVARTRLIDDLVTDALSSRSIGQLVILGAGFDSRAWRLPGLGAVTVFEVDHPATQQAKQQVLGSMSPSASRVRFVPVNFEQDDLGQALRAAGYRHGTPSLFVWEGVTNYLTPAAVDQTLGAVRGLAAGGSRSSSPMSTGPSLPATAPGSRRLAAGSRASGGGASRGGSGWIRPRSASSWPAAASGSSVTCPPLTPASDTFGRWAAGTEDRPCTTWSRPPSWCRPELARRVR
jgi:methyltransferase (TIGR00027 family)